MKRYSVFALALFGLVAVFTSGTAYALPKLEPFAGKFYVYGGGCSRSIRLQGNYATADEAFTAAQGFREKGLVWVTVRTGAHEKDWLGNGATTYHVYTQSPRCGNWSVNATVKTAAEAKDLADKLKGERGLRRVEVIGHYEPK